MGAVQKFSPENTLKGQYKVFQFFSSMYRTHSLETVEQFFTMVLSVFEFYLVCNLDNLSILDLALPGVKGLNLASLSLLNA